MYHSPLRYPGGKAKISPLIRSIIENVGIDKCTYVEPFAGGAGVALSLLFDGTAERIVINDYDKAIYSFWRGLKEDGEEILRLIDETPVTIEEWYNQKRIYLTRNNNYSPELAFATFFLNRTNMSGILNAGPIGGHSQEGGYRMDVRYNKRDLIDRIVKVIERSDDIAVYNKDIVKFIRLYYPKFSRNAFVYFDPPYYSKGKRLYKNQLDAMDHKNIAHNIMNHVHSDWIITYDRAQEVMDLYPDLPKRFFDLNYSVANNGRGSEVLIMKKEGYLPALEEIKDMNLSINLC